MLAAVVADGDATCVAADPIPVWRSCQEHNPYAIREQSAGDFDLTMHLSFTDFASHVFISLLNSATRLRQRDLPKS